MSDPADELRSRAGRILYRELPEEYRYRDPADDGELGDLEAFLHGFGHLLDQIRATTEQAHADSFAEPQDDGRAIQPWVVPYLAELLGAELTAPDPVARAGELNNSVAWFKSKGTLSSIDDIADVVLRSETVAKEGWRMTAQCPRVDLPPFTAEPGLDLGPNVITPDFRKLDRAVKDEDGANPLFRLKPGRHDTDGTDTYWRRLAPGGVPCFPRAYDDHTARTPDLRDPDRTRRVGPHPRRTLIHVRPPQGIFHDGLPRLKLSNATFRDAMEGKEVLRAEDLMAFEELGDGITGPALILELPQSVPLPNRAMTFEGLRFVAANGRKSTLKGAAKSEITFIDCAVQSLDLATSAADPAPLRATDSIFDTILADGREAQLEYCTVMDIADFGRLDASDCLFKSLADTLICQEGETAQSCIRYSRFSANDTKGKGRLCLDARGGSNTTALPQFTDRYHGTGEDCVKRAARYGEPGYGVLDTDTPAAILAGAEDEGEMGAGHGLHHAASLRAVRHKLDSFLPLGQETAIFYDPMLALSPPVLGSEDGE
ncbi:hypothetical protein C8N43_0762 [Litoreibacter ponti]|uniref:Uncharacterized protein n=1 Tax=Litoreibacter ponti TaxID=1510457 RepID=A0A2T6BJ70_9RHOB|nr:hypothetical protein [Litoreibacter ponti]PTX56111.1 hypothetical protein C8N43_0762 [Litoreibacter ponti]